MSGDVDGCGVVTELGMFAHLGGFKKVYRIHRIIYSELWSRREGGNVRYIYLGF